MALALIALSSCRPEPAAIAPNGASPDTRQAIQAADEAWSRANIAGDTAAMNDLYVQDVVSMQAGAADIVGKSAMAADFARTVATRTDTVLQIETVIVSLEQSGDLAWESGHVTLTRRPRDSASVVPRSARFKYITFWQRGADGRWRIRRDLGVADPMP